MNMTIRFLVVVFGTSLVVACSKPDNSIASEETYLKCEGTISIFKDGPFQLVEKQEIAAHVKNQRIGFSGNDFLSGEGIQICTTGASGDQPYFDSESCDGGTRNDPKRKYGTYNKITGALDLTNEVSANGVAFITGRFNCVKTEPVVK
jgi:hypothetical protein